MEYVPTIVFQVVSLSMLFLIIFQEIIISRLEKDIKIFKLNQRK